MADGLFLVAHLQQLLRALHQVADNHHRLDRELPVFVLLLTVLALALAVEGGHGRAGEQRTVLVIVVALLGLAVFLDPLHSLGELILVVDAEVNTAQNLDQRDILRTHTQILLHEICIDNRASNTHTGVAQREVRLAAHRCHSLSSTGKAQNFLCCILRNGIVGQILYIVPIDTVGRQPLLGVSCQHCGQIDSTRALRAIEAPDSLRIVGIHVHRLRTIAPARGDSDGRAHTLALELFGTGSSLTHTPDSSVRDDTLHWAAIAILQVRLNQLLHGLGQTHRLLFQALTDTSLSSINGRTNTNLRIILLHHYFCFSIYKFSNL